MRTTSSNQALEQVYYNNYRRMFSKKKIGTSTRISHNAFKITTLTPGSSALYASISALNNKIKIKKHAHFASSRTSASTNAQYMEFLKNKFFHSPMRCNNRQVPFCNLQLSTKPSKSNRPVVKNGSI